MRRLAGLAFACLLYLSVEAPAWDVNLGLGLDYTLIGRLRYEGNPNADFDFYDNLAWQGRASYSFDNGFKSGLVFDYYAKTIRPNPSTRDDLSMWGLGVYGDYGYPITESGRTRLVGGMEIGYGELTDKSTSFSETAGSVWIAGLAGTRFMIGGKAWLELDYRLAWQEFELATTPQRRYLFSGSSLRLALEYPIFSGREKPEDK